MTLENHTMPCQADAVSATPSQTFPEFVANAVRAAGVLAEAEPVVTQSHPLLNGVPYSVFRREISLDARRKIGAFFSGEAMAKSLAEAVAAHVNDQALVLDPTCGIGDLLLARAVHLPLGPTLADTLAAWGERLAGFDVRQDLVALCKARLCLLARARGSFRDQVDPLAAFPHIVVGDMLAATSDALLARADAVLFNPPFGKTKSSTKLEWATGEINAAAIFLDRLTITVRPTALIAAVLPEVLRCGSRYSRFRAAIHARGYSGSFERRGRFDPWTDVDVFTTSLQRTETPGSLWLESETLSGETLEDRYEVRVGTVVPHRDADTGPEHAYICAKTTPKWSEGYVPKTRRHHGGRTFAPPFVAIRRTSSPSDRFRAVASVIGGDIPVLVENHLLVASPKDGSLAACQALVERLKSPDVNDRLNAVMRCRHLTTGVIKNLPWGSLDD